MLSTIDLAFMRETELLAMPSTAVIITPEYTETALGYQQETWLISGTVNCDIWPLRRNVKEQSSGNQELSEGIFYVSFPHDTPLTVENKVTIDNVLYDITFVPLQQSWLTNLRAEARNYNGSPITLTFGTAIYQSGMDQLISLLTDIKGLMLTGAVTQSEVTAGTVSQQLLASNAGRKGLRVYNNGTATLYLNFGTVASADQYTIRPIEADAYYEMPFPIYTDSIHGIWSAISGTAVITEFN